MELLFRKYFWSIDLAFLALSALLCASAVNAWVGAKLTPELDLQASAPPPRPPAAVGPARLSAEKTAKVLGIELPKEVPVAVPMEPVFDPNADPVRTTLRVTLIGTMVANRPEWSLATIRDDNARETGAYFPGDTILGAEILEIERMRVIIRNQGRKEYIAMGEGGPPPAPVAPVATSAPPARDRGDSAEVQKLDENNYVISRDELDKQLSNLNSIATQARIVPSFKNGVANGFKLFSIRPGSIYSKIGIKNGDVIRRINGYEINSPDKALEVYAKLKESSNIEIEGERGGRPFNYKYQIQ
ncbi:MAG TPA: type II secretion system protein GspC [Vulgatibacter sp.]|nr:type II secretion system protein GspC [Vulgatibacter sp.]